MRIAIIGAGMCGLTAARVLEDAGHAPVLFDKSRGVGGRMATRRVGDDLQFDHGAQYLSAKGDGFAAFLARAKAAGAAGNWTPEGASVRTVGIPGMNAIAKTQAGGLDLRLGTEIAHVQQADGAWQVADEGFDRVILTIPAPQAAQLLGANPLTQALEPVVMAPNLTLLLALPKSASPPFVSRRAPQDDISWIALDSAKTSRTGPDCWVAQASPEWSRAHLELEKDAIAAKMLPMVCNLIGADQSAALHVAGHRWRYALAQKPLGQPFLSDGAGLFIGGDWALAGRVEAAWDSGQAMAKAVLASR